MLGSFFEMIALPYYVEHGDLVLKNLMPGQKKPWAWVTLDPAEHVWGGGGLFFFCVDVCLWDLRQCSQARTRKLTLHFNVSIFGRQFWWQPLPLWREDLSKSMPSTSQKNCWCCHEDVSAPSLSWITFALRLLVPQSQVCIALHRYLVPTYVHTYYVTMLNRLYVPYCWLTDRQYADIDECFGGSRGRGCLKVKMIIPSVNKLFMLLGLW